MKGRGLLHAAMEALGLTGRAARSGSTPETFVEMGRQERDAIREAALQANDSVEIFWEVFDRAPPDVTDYAVKLGMTAPDGYREMIWAEPLRGDDGLIARLLNQPARLPGLRQGSKVSIDEAVIVDWTYEREGLAYGHFGLRALAARGLPADSPGTTLAPTPLEPTEL